MFGYWATGMTSSASAPASVMTIEMTAASRGRSMNGPEITRSDPPTAGLP